MYYLVALLVICMTLCCFGTKAAVEDFTFLLIYVLHELHPAVLEGFTRHASEMVDGGFRKYNQIDVSYTELYNFKFCNLHVEF